MRAETMPNWVAAKFSCRFRLPTEEGPDVCTFKESSLGRCTRELCPLSAKFGGISDG